ncbi:tRNA (N6-threonylcarbamoyladenosine(37)-N6)-methyltransferase TrmO [Methanobrevibacter filiformis]|uniref:Putative tRNA (Adenine(37)-N6)-methyltransferase n=1 Tax=Methanobrevibacter filiformis TaxID=55758 RepID=A0A166DB39_9EURY|nr:tRNA (N6-threonylcarbamoyladenosine(37)-N6)-methyltransferase TrmO [Methanobrevibacter filiformis]KZX15399.1 putative tRNA (adenine(37)-N6)-methyltransferase [Methanobrevibacter filiformis]
MTNIEFKTIGIIETPFNEIEGMPIQPNGANGVKGKIYLNKEFKEGLKDIESFSHLTLTYFLHEIKDYSLLVKPFLDDNTHGIFATRSPKRPNPIGISVVRLNSVKDNVLIISNVDMLNKTPLLDIKPYVPQLYEETCENLKIGWFEKKHKNAKHKKSDDRFKN